MQLRNIREIWLIDYEFSISPGERPHPICLVAIELGSGEIIRMWQNELQQRQVPPYSIGADSLVVAYYASAEMGCHLALGWSLPAYVLDLYAEFRNITNGVPTPCGAGLLGALTYYGLDGIAGTEKEEMRQLALRGGPWTDAEREALLAYCATDVAALAKLLPRMASQIDWPRALLRGRYMKAAAHIEHAGVPLDVETFRVLRAHWTDIQEQLIERIDVHYHVFEGRTFKVERWAQWLAHQGIPWPRLESGNLALGDEIFREMARAYPSVAPIRELRASLSELRLNDLAVGADGRNRCLLSAFRARTGRNQPSNSRFIFGLAVWLRSLIRSQPGRGLAYIDWSQQEFGIAAALSGDPAMITAYESGDPYLSFAKQAGAIPPEGTKQTHGHLRDLFKACVLAVQYGMGDVAFAARIGQSPAHARTLLRKHRETYPIFWRWSDAAVDYAMLRGSLHTVFGWTLHVGLQPNPRSLRNFPMQSNGAEMLRLACCYVTEGSIHLCAPVHDALLIEAPLDELDQAVAATQHAMTEASAAVLGGFRLRSDVKIVRCPGRYRDERGEQMWATVCELLKERLGFSA